MSYVEFIRDGKVVFREPVVAPFAFTGPGGQQVLLGEGQAAVLAGLELRVRAGEVPEERSPLHMARGGDITLARRNVTNVPGGAGVADIMTPSVVESKIPGAPVLKGFHITRKLGEGGMGAVWLAMQLGTHRQVAIKTMTTARLTEEQLARFVLEIEVTAQLDHPNIGRLYESRLDDELCYYAMEFIDGMELDAWSDKTKPDTRGWLRVMHQVCRAVQYAHQKGIIHRDLKPGNVMVTADGSAKVVDFGIAKLVQKDAKEASSKLTTEGEFVGTPAYMSPEQIEAKSNLIDTRTDVYALGVMMYEHVVGQHPFGELGSPMALFVAVLHSEVKAPRSIKPSIDRDLEAVILKAIARNPEERYATAGELADDVRRYLDAEPVLAQPQTTGYLLRKRLRKHRGKVLGAMAVVAAFMAYAVFSYIVILQERDAANEARDVARVAQATAETERDSAEKRFDLGREFANAIIFNLDGRLEAGVTATRAQLVTETNSYLEKLRVQAGDRPELNMDIGRAYVQMGDVQSKQGEAAAATKSYEEALKILTRLDKAEGVDAGLLLRSQADARIKLGRNARDLGELDQALKHTKVAEKLLERRKKADRKDVEVVNALVDVYEDHGKLLLQKGDAKGAGKLFDKALAPRKQRVKDNPKDVDALKELGSSHSAISSLHLERGSLDEALKHAQESLRLRERAVTLAPDNLALKRRVAGGVTSLALVYELRGELDRARESYQQAFDIDQAQVDADPSNARLQVTLLWAYNYIGHILVEQNALDEAVKLVTPAVALGARLAASDKDNVSTQRLNARTLMLAGDLARARRKTSDAVESYEAARKITGPMVEANKDDLYAGELHANVLIGLGRLGGAKVDSRALFEEGIKWLDRLVKGAPHDIYYRTMLANGRLAAGEWAVDHKDASGGLKELDAALELFTDIVKTSPLWKSAREGLVLTLISQGRGQREAAGDDGARACASFAEARRQLVTLGRGEGLSAKMEQAGKELAKLEKKGCE